MASTGLTVRRVRNRPSRKLCSAVSSRPSAAASSQLRAWPQSRPSDQASQSRWFENTVKNRLVSRMHDSLLSSDQPASGEPGGEIPSGADRDGASRREKGSLNTVDLQQEQRAQHKRTAVKTALSR